MRFTILAVLLAALTACSRYSLQQSSVVVPAMVSPTPARDPGNELSLAGSYLSGADHSDLMPSSSLWVARGYGMLTAEHSGKRAGIRLTGFTAPGNGAKRGPGNVLPRPTGNVYGLGPGLTLRAFGTSPVHRLHVTFEQLFVIAPSHVRATCELECPSTQPKEHYYDYSVALMLSAGLHHRYNFAEQVALSWGLTLQTLATNNESLEDRQLSGRSKVRMGPPHPLVDLGLEYTPTSWLGVGGVISYIAPPTPVYYYPMVSLVMRVHTPREEAKPVTQAKLAFR